MKKYRISVQYFYCWANKDTGIWDVNTTKLVIKLEDNIIENCLFKRHQKDFVVS